MSNIGFGTNKWLSWLVIFSIAAIAVFFVIRAFFPQIIEQFAAGVIAIFAFLVGMVFKRKK